MNDKREFSVENYDVIDEEAFQKMSAQAKAEGKILMVDEAYVLLDAMKDNN